jgi:hypothetical protein
MALVVDYGKGPAAVEVVKDSLQATTETITDTLVTRDAFDARMEVVVAEGIYDHGELLSSVEDGPSTILVIMPLPYKSDHVDVTIWGLESIRHR